MFIDRDDRMQALIIKWKMRHRRLVESHFPGPHGRYVLPARCGKRRLGNVNSVASASGILPADDVKGISSAASDVQDVVVRLNDQLAERPFRQPPGTQSLPESL